MYWFLHIFHKEIFIDKALQLMLLSVGIVFCISARFDVTIAQRVPHRRPNSQTVDPSRYRRCYGVNIIPSETANIYPRETHLASLLLWFRYATFCIYMVFRLCSESSPEWHMEYFILYFIISCGYFLFIGTAFLK